MAKPEVRVIEGLIDTFEADAIIVNLFEGVAGPGGATGAVDRALGGAISQIIAEGEITGKAGETALLHTFGKIPAGRVVVAGLGKKEKFDYEEVRRASAAAVKRARESGASRVATVVHGAGIGGLEPAMAAEAVVEGTLLALYSFNEFKSKTEDKRIVKEFILVEAEGQKIKPTVEGARRGRILAEAVNLARDLANRPGNEKTPAFLADRAEEIARAHKMEIEVLDKKAMAELGMGALLGVARGSVNDPRLIVLKHLKGPKDGEMLALIGKGLTFDSGGISIKPSEAMHEMKFDMSGGAAVISAMGAIAELGIRANVVGIVPAAENMPGGNAQRPGDVVKAMNGKTIEVINTDAEGRLILADALCYARKIGAGRIVDVATLTGACVIALGHHCSGLVTNNQSWADKVTAAADEAGERVWQFPAFPEYAKQFESEVADIKNTGGREAGTITGALFIGEFAGDLPWVHLDIAGTAWGVRDVPYQPKGATGVMVRTLTRLVSSLS